MIVQAAIAAHAVEVFLGVLITVVGTFVLWVSLLTAPFAEILIVPFSETYSYGYWFTFIGIMARSEGTACLSNLTSACSVCLKKLHFTIFQDHMRRAGDVCFSDVYREARG
jgi:hypothetical protein